MLRTNNSPPSLSAVLRASTIGSILIALPAFADEAPRTQLAALPDPAPTLPAIVTDVDTGAEEVDEYVPGSRYPRSSIARLLTLPSGVAALGIDETANRDFSSMGSSAIVAYGFTDRIELQIPYSFTTRDFDAKGSVAADAGIMLVRGVLDGTLEAVARVRGGYSALDEAATPVMLGVHLQYSLTPDIALISGYAGTQQLRISVADDAAMTKPIDFSLPFAVGYQATPLLYFQVDTKLATINIHDSANTLIVKDTTPAALTAVYNVVNQFDVQAAVSTDLTNNPGDALTFLVGARYYAGKL